jgi:ribonuclease T1
MRRAVGGTLAGLVCVAWLLGSAWVGAQAGGPPRIGAVDVSALPREAQQTLSLVAQGGPFPYPKDGTVFGNFEKRLPVRERGYYREYTVPTPSSRDRGARRIIAGRGGELYYTDDHYRTFRRIRDQ